MTKPFKSKRKSHIMYKCENCGHIWTPRVPYPKQCPRCKRYLEYE